MTTQDAEGGLFDEVRSRLMLDGLPDYFLRISDPSEPASRNQAAYGSCLLPIYVGHLRISIVEAKLVKNYGWISMSPYVRCRVGQNVFETTTASNGGLNPKWDRSVVCLLPKGISKITIEIYDERLFTSDVLVASVVIPLPKDVFEGCCIDDWYPLSGKQGENKEGKINVIISLVALQANPAALQMSSTNDTRRPSQPSKPIDIDSAVEELNKIYPAMSPALIRTLLVDHNGDKHLTASILADMTANSQADHSDKEAAATRANT